MRSQQALLLRFDRAAL